MIVRALDGAGDWTFGKGYSDYLTGNPAVGQNIQTRLKSFLGNCFFDLAAGIDWFNLLGGKNKTALTLAISTVLINTRYVIAIRQLSVDLDPVTRNISIVYNVTTVFTGTLQGSIMTSGGYLLDELGNIITDENGNQILV